MSRIEREGKLSVTSSSFAERGMGFLRSEVFFEAAGENLDSPAFPDTFAPSAFHLLVHSLVSGQRKIQGRQKWAGIDWVYRHVDLEKVGFSPFHLSAFRMLVFLEAVSRAHERECRQRTVDYVLALVEILGKRPQDLFITYFGGEGASVTGCIIAEDIRELWLVRGIPDAQVIAVAGRANLTNVLRVGEPAGPRCEIFLRWEGGKFLEIGTVVFERFLVDSAAPLILREAPSVVCGAAMGVERGQMVMSGAVDVFAVPELSAGVDAVRGVASAGLADLQEHHTRRFVDAVRSAMIIAKECSLPLGRSRSRRLSRLRNGAMHACEELGIRDVATAVGTVGRALQPFLLPAGETSAVDTARMLLTKA